MRDVRNYFLMMRFYKMGNYSSDIKDSKDSKELIIPLAQTVGFQCQGNSNWTICSLLSPFLFLKFSNFFTFRLGSQFLLGERNNEFPGLSLNLEESFLIVGIVTHFVESHHQKLCTYISHFDLSYLLQYVFCQKYSSY